MKHPTEIVQVQVKELSSLIDRIENIDEQIEAVSNDKKELMRECKFRGYDTKVIKRILKLKKMDPAEIEEENQLLMVYAKELKIDIQLNMF